ncbi:phage tail tip lysozyme [Actinoplanes sp. NPDC000266]
MTASTAVLEHREVRRQAMPGRLVVGRLPQLARHVGSPPDLVLRWNRVPAGARVDVVVHLHGFSARGRGMNLVRDKLPVSGLDLSGRPGPALGVLPRGHFFGGRSGHGFSFPALRRRGALGELVDDALRRFNGVTGAGATKGRLILTAHSGGGAALMQILGEADPDEVYAFDALYTDPAPLIAWARRKGGNGAMRVIYRAGEGTAANSLRVGREVPRSARFRVEDTATPHNDIPRMYGARLLADPAADLSQGPPSGPPATQLSERIAQVARAEFRRWRPGGGAALTEMTPAASPILREYYQAGVGVPVTDAQLRSAAYQSVHPWSAVFISYVMRTAGAGAHFAYSPAHQTYIRAARRNRLGNLTGNPFWAYRVDEVAPRVGDLVCNARAGSGATYDNIGDAQTRATHCDVVTEIQQGRIRVIGGNVGQTVGEKWLTTRPDGRLSTAGRQSTFFAIISTRGPRRADPAAPAAPAASPAPAAPAAPGDVNARAARVMELLVQRYRYPVAGAAGLVGNLMAESGVIPERIEGSAENTPTRARGFDGQVRTFTPEQIRDRDKTRGLGPQLPGVGLAQWTSANRRAGLFTHTFDGRRPGAGILSDLAAQVDYLVTELGRDYQAVDAVLRTPAVTVDQASDIVLLRFEVPAVVFNGKPGDPAVQAELARRRGFGQRALSAYQRGRP